MLWECLSLVPGVIHPCPSILPHLAADVKRETGTYLSVHPTCPKDRKRPPVGDLLGRQRLAEDVSCVAVADVDVRDVRRVDQLLELLDVVVVR